MSIEVDQIWREKKTNRLIKILEVERGPGPAWTYCDKDGTPEPHGVEPANGHNYGEWFWHYCDVHDFCVWKRFELVSRI